MAYPTATATTSMGLAPGQIFERKPIDATDRPCPVRRFVARMIDLTLVAIVVDGIALLLLPKFLIEPLALRWIVAGGLLVPIEATLIWKWGTTPGKRLMRCFVTRIDGGALNFQESLDRSLSAMAWGLGGLIPFLAPIFAGWSYHDLQTSGTTRWDRRRFRMRHGEISAARWAGAVLLFLALLIVLAAIDAARMLFF